MSYGFNAIAVNEMFAPRWMNQLVCFYILHSMHIFSNILKQSSKNKNKLRELCFWLTKKIPLQASYNATRLGVAVLESFGVFSDKNWYLIGAGGLLGFTVLFNVLYTLALMYLNRKDNILFKGACEFAISICFFQSDNFLSFLLFKTLAMGKPQAIISEEAAGEMEADYKEPSLRRPVSKRDSNSQLLSPSDGNNTSMQQNIIGNFSLLHSQSSM